MGLIKKALIGAAIYGAVKYLTKTDEITGRSKMDDFLDEAPNWIQRAKQKMNGTPVNDSFDFVETPDPITYQTMR